MDGVKTETKPADKVAVFAVPITGEHEIEVRAKAAEEIIDAPADFKAGTPAESGLCDRIHIRKVEQPNPEYAMPRIDIVNWFDREDMQVREGYFSIKDSVADVKKVPEAAALLAAIQEKVTAAYGDVAKNVKMPESVVRQMEAMPVEAMFKQTANIITPEMVVELNRELNKIKKTI